MKKKTNKIITGILISTITLLIGYAVTKLSFNIFGELSTNQMRAVFAADLFALTAVGTFAYFFYENKKLKEKRKREVEKRRLSRIEKSNKEMSEINRIIFQSNKVA